MNLKIFIAFALALGLAGGCKKKDDTLNPSNPGANEVWMQNNIFSPASITVPANTTIKWINKDGAAHTVTSNTGSFDSGSIAGGNTYSHQFTAAGTYPYNCSLHSGMSGTVIVQ